MSRVKNFNKTVCDFCDHEYFKADKDRCFSGHGKDESFKQRECHEAKSKFLDARYQFARTHISKLIKDLFSTADEYDINYSEFQEELVWETARFKYKSTTGKDITKELTKDQAPSQSEVLGRKE